MYTLSIYTMALVWYFWPSRLLSSNDASCQICQKHLRHFGTRRTKQLFVVVCQNNYKQIFYVTKVGRLRDLRLSRILRSLLVSFVPIAILKWFAARYFRIINNFNSFRVWNLIRFAMFEIEFKIPKIVARKAMTPCANGVARVWQTICDRGVYVK